MSDFKSILIVGAAGRFVGSLATDVFLKAGWEVHILVSANSLNTKKYLFITYAARGAKLIVADVSQPDTYVNQISGIDVVLCSLGPTMVDEQIVLAKAAKQANVKLFLPSEYGFDINNIPDNPIFDGKRKVRKAIEEIGIDYMYIVTGPFLEHLVSWSAWGVDVKNSKVTQVGERDTKVTTVSIDEVVEMLPQIVNDKENINKSLAFGNTTTTGEIFDLAVVALGPGVETNKASLEDLETKIKNIKEMGPELFGTMMLKEIAKGNSEVKSCINGEKYGKRFTTAAEFIPKFIPKVRDGLFIL